MKEKFSKLLNVYKKYGLIGFLLKLKSFVIANYFDKINLKTFLFFFYYKTKVRKMLNDQPFERVILWRSSFGYNVNLFQRPQHIANNLSKKKCLVFYEVTSMTDNIKNLKKISNNLILFNFNNIILNKLLMRELNKINKPKYIQLYSTDWKLSVSHIKKYIKKGYKFIYEFIDELSPELSGTKQLPQNIVDKFEYVMNNKDVFVVVTASKLEEIVKSRRGNINLCFSSNGVDNKFFKNIDKNFEFDDEFNKIMNLGKPIVCYYGALAKWFDYELIKKIAKTDKYSVVLFGIKYDESFDLNINKEKNIYFLGPRDYKVLKNYANRCDILTIPFLINDITEATSPVKIFEYMALNKPIVITNLRECRNYKGVFVARDHVEFLLFLEEALIKNSKSLKLLSEEAKNNDWSMKAQIIINLIMQNEKSNKNIFDL